MLSHGLLAALAAALLSTAVAGQGMYPKGSSVLNVDAKNYHKLITKSNQVSIVEFYAPWCGHCKNLKPKYEKAARGLKDLGQVAAINCDEESNKPLCSSMGVQGFPTLKIVRPSKKAGKPIVEDYNGQREAKAIIDAVKSAIPNNVKRVTDKTLDTWLDTDNSTGKAILFSDKGVTGALSKVLANEFLGRLNFGQVRNTEKKAVETFGVTEYPALLILPGGSLKPVTYDGSFNKASMKEFLGTFAPKTKLEEGKEKVKEKAEKVKEKAQKAMGNDPGDPKADAADESSFSSASSAHQASEASSAAASATDEFIVEEVTDWPTESPTPAVTPDAKPIALNVPDPIPTLSSKAEVLAHCLGEKTSTCVLAFISAEDPSEGEEQAATTKTSTALGSLAEIAAKHRGRSQSASGGLFPFYAIPASNEAAQLVQSALQLSGDVEVIAINGRRNWWRHFTSEDYGVRSVEDWVDNIRFGEGKKEKIPDGLLVDEAVAAEAAQQETTTEDPVADPEPAAAPDEKVEEPETPEEPEEPEPPVHGEL